jgi:8-oxo-dGTP diphosphatase
MSYFNIRVYGLLINERQEVLLSDEFEQGQYFTKFPGGGVELGEGLIEALKREFVEECSVEIEVMDHFYTTDFYEKSSFNDSQIISIYYLVKEKQPLNLNFKKEAYDFDVADLEANQSFRWIPIDLMTEEEVTFNTDKIVVKRLKKLLVANGR